MPKIMSPGILLRPKAPQDWLTGVAQEIQSVPTRRPLADPETRILVNSQGGALAVARAPRNTQGLPS